MLEPDGGPAVSVVVATRRRPQHISRCVEALLAQDTADAYEIVVVNDDAEPLVGLPHDPRLRLVQNRGRGVASARNHGVAVSVGRVIAFTDDDTLPSPAWIRAVAAAAREAPDVVAFEGPVEVGPLDPLYEHAPRAGPGLLCAANVAYRRVAFDRLGGFDEWITGLWSEDRELAERAKAIGPTRYVPDMVVAHPPRPITFRELLARAEQVEGVWYLFRRHPSLSGGRVPLRWSPVALELRKWAPMTVSRAVVRGSPVRAARAVALCGCTTTVAFAAAWRRWPGPRA